MTSVAECCPKCGAGGEPHCGGGGCTWRVCRRPLCAIVYDPNGRTTPILTKGPAE